MADNSEAFYQNSKCALEQAVSDANSEVGLGETDLTGGVAVGVEREGQVVIAIGGVAAFAQSALISESCSLSVAIHENCEIYERG